MTATRVVTARMTPNNVRKLRSLCTRRDSSARRKVSVRVIRVALSLPARRRTPTGRSARRGRVVSPSIGATPNLPPNDTAIKDAGTAFCVPGTWSTYTDTPQVETAEAPPVFVTDRDTVAGAGPFCGLPALLFVLRNQSREGFGTAARLYPADRMAVTRAPKLLWPGDLYE